MQKWMLIFCFAIGGCSALQGNKGKEDLKNLCSYAQSFDWSQSDDPAQLAHKFSDGMYKILKSREVTQMMKALSAADANQKWELFIEGTKEIGVTNYKCPALKNYMTSENKKMNPAPELSDPHPSNN